MLDCQGGCTEAVTLRFEVTVTADLPAPAALFIRLLDEQGREGAYNSTRSATLRPGEPVVFESVFLVIPAPLPLTTATVEATLVGDQAGRSHHLQQSLPLVYRFVEPPPATSTPTPPRILEMDWDAWGPTGDHACPLPEDGRGWGEGVDVWCEVKDDNGDALTISVSAESQGPGQISGQTRNSVSFAPSPYERRVTVEFFMLERGSDVRVTCEATDSLGLRTETAIRVPCAGVP